MVARCAGVLMAACVGMGMAGAGWAKTINVPAGNVSALKSDLKNAKPGDTLVLNGTYDLGNSGLSTSVDGTANGRITVMGGAGGATLKGGTDGSGIACDNAYYTFSNLTITGFQKSVRIDGGMHGILDSLTCVDSHNESIKLKGTSQYWLVENCHVFNAGMEGYYVSDANQNWEGGVVDRSGYVTFLNDTTYNTGNDGFDFKEGAHDIKVINAVVDWAGGNPGAQNDEGNSGVYDRGNNIQIINLLAENNVSSGEGVRAFTSHAQDGKTYGANTEIFALSGSNLDGGLIDDSQPGMKVYRNYSMTGVPRLLDGGSPTFLPASAFEEMTWVGEGGGLYYQVAPVPEAGTLGVMGVGVVGLLQRRRG